MSSNRAEHQTITFTAASPLAIGEPIVDRGGVVTGRVLDCVPACGEAFDITVDVAGAGDVTGRDPLGVKTTPSVVAPTDGVVERSGDGN